MVGWKMEVWKMFLYISFPVACFSYFNHPQLYEEALNEMRKPYETTAAKLAAANIDKLIKEYERERQKKDLEDLEAGKSVFN